MKAAVASLGVCLFAILIAGPVRAQAPAAANEPARLELRSPQEDVSFHWTLAGVRETRARREGYVRLCTAPCSAELPPGRYRLGLAQAGGDVVPADPLDLRGPVEIEGVYTSRASVRAAGWTLLVGSALAGLLLATISEETCSLPTPEAAPTPEMCSGARHPYLWLGVGVALAGVGGGIALALWPDRAELRARPVP